MSSEQTTNREAQFFMQRCLQLAANGLATTAPNPMVGAVVVHEGRIIGEGWHRQAGLPHAEPQAIASVKCQELLPESTLYVSLEPCAHYGKTPPCADLIVEKRIPRVVIGCLDPFPAVSGKGLQRLQQAGIETVVGVEEQACRWLNRRFFRYHLSHRPYIVLKWAQSQDGFIDRPRQDESQGPAIFSTPFTAMAVHQLRTQCDAVMVGTRTALMDNPALTCRLWPAQRQPLRIVLDREAALPARLKVFDDSCPTLVFNEKLDRRQGNTEWIPLYRLEDILDELYRRQVQTLLVEGGSHLHQSFIDHGLWDEIRVETSPESLGHGHPAARLPREVNDGKCLKHIWQPTDNANTVTTFFRKPVSE
ncbi:MAG: bifunctional diaminohydroxyphosphoribosylaminopyrimidine deaminase/5-amino-6-(5-phosphoribosylamino)uracil reductase RibD [Bacteroidales bacterium]|nr:bifunctional diaminohydroxyphosphoribosylaminopyrimidine deaminase/5-amino-6-(5-phosphoribosylamino)uracil reductase RibD [Bacteroidales bacterium]